MTTTDHQPPTRTHRAHDHRAALMSLNTKRDQVRYACSQLPSPTGGAVQNWLRHYGIDAGRTLAATEATAWRKQNGMVNTGDLQALTAEVIAGLDAERAEKTTATDGHTPEANSEHEPVNTEQPERADLPDLPAAVTTAVNTEHDYGSEQPERTANSEQVGLEPVNTPTVNEHPTGEQVAANSEHTAVPVNTEQRTSGGEQVSPPAAPPMFGAPQLAPAEHRTAEPVNTAPDIEMRAEGDEDEPARTDPVVPEADAPAEERKPAAPLVVWPVLLMAMAAFVAVWSGWVGLGEMTGFGEVRPLPGIADSFVINSAITLPIGVEAYAAYAMYVWLSGRCRNDSTVSFAKWSSIGALLLGAAGQIAYHLLEQAQADERSAAQAVAAAAAAASGQIAERVVLGAPWWITTFVSCLPVVVVGLGAALAHMVRSERENEGA
ncbi:hypothetical protein [Nocardia jinanensis]|uniref:Uncharacterized protein n=1 Tax=Nocardia jinanensis TaxID=382504 RepID=A0A917RZ15_9NOCA|nr:hypothetical protein [Nocardia jinanensis]GGL44146.1 hypothetical protein GCM10011588_68560 [Nocardia jinanensis]